MSKNPGLRVVAPLSRLSLCISGLCGRMGHIILGLAVRDEVFQDEFGDAQVFGVDSRVDLDPTMQGPNCLPAAYLADLLANRTPSVLLIFHNKPDEVVSQTQMAANFQVPVVIGTTGLTTQHIVELRKCSEKVAILRADNFSLGITALIPAVCQLVKALPGFKVEIVETHHDKKADVPSGTAYKIAFAICKAQGIDPEKFNEFIRVGRAAGRSDQPHPEGVVYIHSLRGGTVPGIHKINLLGPQEILEISHCAQSPEIFARGALETVKFVAKKPAGWYTVERMLGLE